MEVILGSIKLSSLSIKTKSTGYRNVNHHENYVIHWNPLAHYLLKDCSLLKGESTSLC